MLYLGTDQGDFTFQLFEVDQRGIPELCILSRIVDSFKRQVSLPSAIPKKIFQSSLTLLFPTVATQFVNIVFTHVRVWLFSQNFIT